MFSLSGSSPFRRLGLLAIFPAVLFAQANSPRIYYTDIDSGPNTGGENNQGAFVTISGTGFGSSIGSSRVSFGGGAVASYRAWSDSKIIVALGPSALSGNILVNTSAGTSNPMPFTVRSGNIYFVATTGSDTASGSFAAPWKTLLKARDAIEPGDIVYARNGVAQITDDGEGWSACITIGTKAGTAAMPMAMVVYPNETATIGHVTNCASGVRTKGYGESYWTFAGFLMRGKDEALTTYDVQGWRLVGNDMTCPNGDGATACYETSISSYLKVYGNNVHDTGIANATALYHGVYFSTDSNHIDFGWNTIANVHGCRGLQVHSSPLNGGGASDPTGHDQYDLKIHDNVIHDTQCDGIVLYTVDPSKGAIEVYNNLIYNAGKGPNNPEGSGNWSCIYVAGYTNTGPIGSGTVEVYANTMYACGTFSTPPYGRGNSGVTMAGPNPAKKMRLRNNIIQLTTNVPYIEADDGITDYCNNCTRVSGSNNLFFGSPLQPALSSLTGTITSNPLLLAPAAGDFHLGSGSPAAIAGLNVGLATDFDGRLLPQGSGFPIGALALSVSGPPTISVSITPALVTLQPGQTQAFNATVSATPNTAVSWSLNPALGSLSVGGVYTAPASITVAQTVIVTAISVADSSKSGTATISLTPPPVVAVQITPASISRTNGQTQQFAATVTGSTNTAVTWSLSPAVGTLSATGLYTAPVSITTAQSVLVRATSVADPTKSATATVSLTVSAAIAVQLTPATVSRTSSQTQQFTATVTGSTTTTVTWSMSPAVGTLSATGLYTAPSSITSAQTVLVKATSVADTTKSATASVSLTVPAAIAVQLNPASVSLSQSQTQQFAATVTGSTTTTVTWSMSPAVGTLSATGIYTAPSSITTAQTVLVKATSVADSSKSATATVSLVPTFVTPPPASSSAIRIRAGATTPYTDPQGTVWGADTGFTGITATYAIAGAISNTTTPTLYQSERYASYGTLQYQFPVANGTYNVKLKFAEIYNNASGLRLFNIVLNGATVESNFDIFAAAGGANKAIDKTIAVNATNGMITIQLLPVTGNPKVNSIEITAVAPPPPPASSSAIRIRAGSTTPYTDPQGLVWGADTGFSGTTSTYSITGAISNTTTPLLYQSERYASYGTLQYQFPVANGTYNVKLKFAEIYNTASGLRRFNVVLNGATVESNFDIFAAAGAATAIDRNFSVNSTNGLITIQLVPVTGNPKINSIEITPAAASSTAIRINAGSTTPYTDPQGLVWGADTGFSGTTSTYSITGAISNTTTPLLYQSERYASYGTLQYQFPVANGTYNVKLKFAEIYNTASGMRRFNIVLNGVPVESNFDIFASSGAAKAAIDRTFSVTTTSGLITIQLVPVIGNPKISAIEIQ